MDETIEITIRCNEEYFNLHEPVDRDDPDHIYNITNDNEYLARHVINLINHGVISLRRPLERMCRVHDDMSEEMIYEPRMVQCGESLLNEEDNTQNMLQHIGSENDEEVSEGSENKETCQWNEGETRFLLNMYELYVTKVGPMKKFKSKKAMWSQIATDVNNRYNIKRSGLQVENRYKTILKRKKIAVDNNSTSGAARMEVPFETELSKIASIDDSIQPELLRSSAEGLKILKSSDSSTAGRKKLKTVHCENGMNSSPSTSQFKAKENINNIPRKYSVTETLLYIHKEKEKSRERRHAEKMSLLKRILESKNGSSDD